jgi:hypothetical protein
LNKRTAPGHNDIMADSIPYATPNPRGPRLGTILLICSCAALAAGLLAILLLGSRRVSIVVTPATPATAPVAAAPFALPPPLPPVLDLPDEPPRLTVIQRRTAYIPGSGGTVFLHLGDITAGKALLRVDTTSGQTLAGAAVRPGDAVNFSLDGKGYVAVAAAFELHLLHDDRGEFVVRRAEDPPTDEELMGQLIAAAAKSDAVVVAPLHVAGAQAAGSDSTPKAEQYLRDVWQFTRPNVRTPADLVRAAGRPKDPTANGPVLRFPDGRETRAETWLSDELKKFQPPTTQP